MGGAPRHPRPSTSQGGLPVLASVGRLPAGPTIPQRGKYDPWGIGAAAVGATCPLRDSPLHIELEPPHQLSL